MVRVAPRRGPGPVKRHQYQHTTAPTTRTTPQQAPVAPVEAAPANDKSIIKIDHPAVICEDGPWHRWSYYEHDMITKQRLWNELRMSWSKLAGRADYEAFPYIPTRRSKIHPGTDGKVTSAIWAYRPSRSPMPE